MSGWMVLGMDVVPVAELLVGYSVALVVVARTSGATEGRSRAQVRVKVWIECCDVPVMSSAVENKYWIVGPAEGIVGLKAMSWRGARWEGWMLR